MGCHAFSQSVQGGDFSFLVSKTPAGKPETPQDATSQELKARYRFAR